MLTLCPQVLAEVLPHQAGRVVYHYDPTGRLGIVLYGDASAHYHYHQDTGG